MNTPNPSRSRRFLKISGILLALLAVAGIGARLTGTWPFNPGAEGTGAQQGAPGPGGPGGFGGRRGDGGSRPQPVRAASVRQGDIDVIVTALGTVTARNTVTVKPRVDGQLVALRFKEGQSVKAGEVLAEIDPRPFQVVVDQAQGQLLRDQALLTNAELDLERYKGLAARDAIAKQQVDTQEALVRQYRGTVESDKAQLESARLQLSFTRVTAPAAGRLGLRQVDLGNMVHASDTAGIVVITQTQPINAVFAVPSDYLTTLTPLLRQNKPLTVEAWDKEGRKLLASGVLASVDNQIDTTTGTVKLKAEFPNREEVLFPNQFVNIRLKLDTRHDALLLPQAAIQRGTQGTYVYVIEGEEKTVAIRPVSVGVTQGETVAIDKGLAQGDSVVLDGGDKLRPGAKVEVIVPEAQAGSRNRDRAPANGVPANGAPASGTPTRGEAPRAAPGGGSAQPPTPAAAPPSAPAGAQRFEPGSPEAEARREEWRKRREAEEANLSDAEKEARREERRRRRAEAGEGGPRGPRPE